MTDMNDWNQQIIAEFRANDGKVGGQFEGAPLLLLHTTGAKSGQERIAPVMCGHDGDHLFVIASKAGADTSPDWFHNLVANPTVTVELGTEQFDATASVAPEPDRTRIYDTFAETFTGFAEYAAKTTRTIPVVLLTRS